MNTQEQFLAQQGWQNATRQNLPGDFSARHYIRLKQGDKKAMLMIMPKPEELAAFLSMQKAIEQSGVRVPAVYAEDVANGFALIEDLGDMDFGALLRTGRDAAPLYKTAIDALIALQKAPQKNTALPIFTADIFLKQAELFLDVYAEKVLKNPLSNQMKDAFNRALLPALQKACAANQSIMLRDFHAANIMYLENGIGHKKAAIIDFQDGGAGPISYDVASLLEDARLDIPEKLRAEMLDYYFANCPSVDRAQFMTSYHILACQRHLRVLAILARRWVDLNAPHSGEYFSRVWKLLMQHQTEPSLSTVYAWLDAHIPAAARENWKPA